jgi:hypothetical protein
MKPSLPILRFLIPGLLLAVSLSGAHANEILWLSESAPKREAVASGNDSLDAQIADSASAHNETKRLWLRQGSEPGKAAYLQTGAGDSNIELVDIQGQRTQIVPKTDGGMSRGQIGLANMGFYNAYFARRHVDNGVLDVQLAKAELLKGSCCIKEADFDPRQREAISDSSQPLEIIRTHLPDERLFTRLVSGDRLTFTVHRFGQPLAGVTVTLLTQQGWQKNALSNAQGQVEFTLIRDYFPDWRHFYRLSKSTFVVVAETEQNESGSYGGQTYRKARYQATLSGRYALSPYDYKSYAWGLGVSLFVIVFGGLAIYLYRRRRVKPFREVRFHESA